jgi:hypothetical protein
MNGYRQPARIAFGFAQYELKRPCEIWDFTINWPTTRDDPAIVCSGSVTRDDDQRTKRCSGKLKGHLRPLLLIQRLRWPAVLLDHRPALV